MDGLEGRGREAAGTYHLTDEFVFPATPPIWRELPGASQGLGLYTCGMNNDPDVIRIEARLAEVSEAKRLAEARVKELTEALTAARATEAVAKEADKDARNDRSDNLLIRGLQLLDVEISGLTEMI